jgi:DNA-binding response OmpR family regulator
MTAEQTRILIVEDDHVLRTSIIEYLELVGYLVTGAGSGREFYRALDAGTYDLAIIDVGLPDQSGLVLAAYLHANTAMGIIILTARDGVEDQFSGYESGADLYMTKPVSTKVLASAIAKLVQRVKSPPPSSQQVEVSMCWILDQTSWTLLTPDNTLIELTSLELEFLKMLMKSSGDPVSRELLIKQLYPSRIDDYSGRALDALVRRLRDKISNAPGKPNPVKSSYGIGFCFAEPLSLK